MPDHLASPVAGTLALTLLHFLWQGALIALVYWGVIEATSIRSVRIRYVLSLAAMCLMALSPVVTFTLIDGSATVDRDMSLSSQRRPATQEEPVAISEYIGRLGARSPEDVQHARDRVHHANSRTGVIGQSESVRATLANLLQSSKPYILVLWLAGVMLSGARLLAGLLNVVWLRSGRQNVPYGLTVKAQRLARRLGLATSRVFTSDRVRTAAVAGFWKPVVLLPTSWLMSLPPDVVEAVIAHELAHIRRFDVWSNLLQRIVETLLFYHPAVWWLSNRIRLEREMCCDELAIMATGDRGNYAVALEQVGWLQTFGTPRLAPSFSGEKKMNLLSRIQNVLGTASRPQREPAWILGIVAVAIPLVVAGAIGHFTESNSAIAQEREGRRSAEADAESQRSPEAEGRRRSAEEEAGPWRSPEAESGPRRSAEAEAGPRRSAEGERGAARSPERDRPRGNLEEREEDSFAETLGDFKPQTERETALFRMIQQLQREIAAVRRDVRSRNFRGRDGDRDGVRGERDGDRNPRGDGRRDQGASREGRDQGSRELSARWESTKEGRVFKAYDKNSDGSVTLEEWLAMTNGNVSPARKEVQTKRYKEADPNGDGKFTPGEFIYWYSKGRFERLESTRRDGDGAKGGPRDGEESERGTREGDREETPRNTRDGDGERQRGKRDGEAAGRRGPRDGERDSANRKDSDREREDGKRDGDREE